MPVTDATLTLTNGIALRGEDLHTQPFTSLVIRNGVIESIDDSVEPGSAEGSAIGASVDLAGGYLLPGLVDCHVHFDLAAQPAAYERWLDPRAQLIRSLSLLHNGVSALAHGITSVRDLGCVDSLVLDYAAYVEKGLLTGPRVTAAGRPLTTTGGHCSQYGRVASGATDVREAVREQMAAGATVIKVIASGGISTPGDPNRPQFTDEELAAAVDEAHRLGLRVAAHAHAPIGIKMAVRAGVDSIEHAGFADDEAIAMLVEHGTALVPTVVALNHIAEGVGIPAATVRKSLEARERYRASTQRAIESGVTIAAGTDAGTALNPIGDLHDELDMYCERGMTALDAVRAATVNAGRLLGTGVGVVEVGRPADLLVVADDPREDVTALRTLSRVISRGRLISQTWLADTEDELSEAVTGRRTTQTRAGREGSR
jgi:imidazolonepropionase-like amidohydrolase